MGAPETQQFQPLTLTVALDDTRRQHLVAAQAIVEDAEALVVDCAQMAEHANSMLRDVKSRKQRLEAMHDDICGPIRKALENARKWFTPAIDATAKAEQIIKGKLADFTRREQERIAAAERARKEAERRAIEQAEQEAAAARARAEEAARKAREEAEAAERRRREEEERARAAREAGDRKAAAEAERRAQAAAAEAARKEAEERQRREAAEAEAARIQMEAAAKAQACAPEVPEATKVIGFGMRKNWTAVLADGVDEEKAKRMIVAAIAGGRDDLYSLITLDMKAAKKLAKALEANFNVPGLRAFNDPVATSRG